MWEFGIRGFLLVIEGLLKDILRGIGDFILCFGVDISVRSGFGLSIEVGTVWSALGVSNDICDISSLELI